MVKTPDVVRLHPYYTYQILERVPVFGEFAFDALSADRPYRPAMPLDRVFGILTEDAGRDLCPDCVAVVKEVAV